MQRPLAGLTRRNVGRELLAGVTLIAIAIPLNIGYAQIAGLPPTAGLYALVVPTIVYALVVSSRQLVASPDAAAAALVASSIGGLAVAGSADYAAMALAQAIICGVLFVLLAVFKLGFLANFLSKPILVGFVGGLALDILVSQIAKMLGVKIDSGGEFIDKVVGLVTGLGTSTAGRCSSRCCSVDRPPASGGGCARRAVGARRAGPRDGRRGARPTADQAGVDVLGEVPAGPPALTWPVLEWTTWLALVPSAIALTMVTIAEGLLVSRSLRREAPLPDPSQPRPASRSGSATSPPVRQRQLRDGIVDVVAPRRWTRRGRARSCRRSCSRSARFCFCSSARRCSPTSRHPPSARSSRWRSCRCSASAEFIGLWRLDRFEFDRRGRLLPRDAVHRRDPRHRRRLRARAHQPRASAPRIPPSTCWRSTTAPPTSLLDERAARLGHRARHASSSAWRRRCSSRTATSFDAGGQVAVRAAEAGGCRAPSWSSTWKP